MITQVLTPFDSTKQAIEGTTSFRANASYSWSWLIEHSNQQNTLISQINSTTTEMNSLAQTVTTKAQEVANNTTTVNQAKLDAQSARDSAIAANNAAQAIYDTFDDRYLGTKTIAPTLDNDGNALQSGALYFNSTSGKLFIYDLVGVKWVDITTIPTLLSSLSDVAFTTKSNNDVLQYDSATGKWVNRSFYSKAELDAFIAGKIPKITTPTTNALAKINTDGTLKNSAIIEDANGNVGIGDLNPAYKLSLVPSTALPSTAGSKITAFSKYVNVGNASFLRFDTVRISAGSSHTTSEERIRKTIDFTEMGYIGFGDNNVVFGNAGGKLATLNTYGFAIDTGAYTSQSYWSNSSKSAGTDWMHFYGTSNNNSVMNIAIYGNGSIQNATNSYGAFSDIKLKENIIDVSPKLDKLMKVRVVNYNLIGQEQKQIGVIAQEIEQIFPGLIDETKDTKQVEIEKERLIPALDEIIDNDGNVVQESKPEYIEKYMGIETIETGETTKSVKYSVLYMMMLKGIQEQQEIINSLIKRVETLEGAK